MAAKWFNSLDTNSLLFKIFWMEFLILDNCGTELKRKNVWLLLGILNFPLKNWPLPLFQEWILILGIADFHLKNWDLNQSFASEKRYVVLHTSNLVSAYTLVPNSEVHCFLKFWPIFVGTILCQFSKNSTLLHTFLL